MLHQNTLLFKGVKSVQLISLFKSYQMKTKILTITHQAICRLIPAYFFSVILHYTAFCSLATLVLSTITGPLQMLFSQTRTLILPFTPISPV